MYIYESHLGGLYASESGDLDIRCEKCGDSDWLIGEFISAIEFLKFYADNIDTDDNHGGYFIDPTLAMLACFGDCPDKKTAIKIIEESRQRTKMKRWKDMSNWAKAVIVLCSLLLLMLFPPTRQLILLILPLGSGIDDLIFFAIVALIAIFLLIKASTTNVIEKICNWLKK